MGHESLLNGLWRVQGANAVCPGAVVPVIGDMKEVQMRYRTLRLTLVAAFATAALSACVVAPAPGYGYYGATVYEAPPEVQYEAVGVAPAPGYFWIGGSWFWEGGRYAWHPGYWSAPRSGYHWAPRTWERSGNGWRAREGGWERGERHWDHDR